MRPLPLMLFAAGFGTRMGALTANRPKPMIEVAGKPLIDHAITQADGAGITTRVMNLHYLGDQLAAHVEQKNFALSWERAEILETGGGLRTALPLLGPGPVLAMNSDAVWTGENPLSQLLTAWNPDQMDALLLLLPAEEATGHAGAGDFILSGEDRIARANGAAGHVYLGAQIIRTDTLAAFTEHRFSLNLVWDAMIARNRAFGLVHRGGWCDVGSPNGIALAEQLLAKAADAS